MWIERCWRQRSLWRRLKNRINIVSGSIVDIVIENILKYGYIEYVYIEFKFMMRFFFFSLLLFFLKLLDILKFVSRFMVDYLLIFLQIFM